MKNWILFGLFTLSLIPGVTVYSQTDREFWFVAPEISKDHEDRPINFTFITTDLPAHVKLEMPANVWSVTNPTGLVPYEFDVPAFSVYKLDVTAQINVIEDQFATTDGIAGKNKKGIHITSNNLINCYYEEGITFNPDIFALKGNNALGTEFFCSFQTRAINMSGSGWVFPAYSAFEIVFTEDNTFITLTIPTGKGVYNGGGAPLTGVKTLGPFNRGETYQGAPAWVINPKTGKYGNDKFGRSAPDHLAGTKITTNGKKIAVTLKDDSMKSLVGGCYNLGGDQTIPVGLTGTEYIVMKGQLSTGSLNSTYYNPPPVDPVNQETIYVLATDNNTQVMIDGVWKATLNAGQTYVHEIVNPITRVTSADSGVYVWQITGTGCEYGAAILPTVSVCTGSLQVGFTRSTSDNFFMNVMVRKKAKDGFRIFRNGVYNAALSALLSPAVFTDIAGSEWAAARIAANAIPVGLPIMVTNDTDVFHLGIINGGSSNGTRYGYFSDYNPLRVQAFITESGSSDIRLCFGSSAQIVARGGTFYKWVPSSYLSDSLSALPIATPPVNQAYKAYVKGACDQKDSTIISIQVSPPLEARYNVDTTFGCAPLKLKIRNQSYGVKKVRWDFGDGQKIAYNYTVDKAVDTIFTHTFLLNASPLVTRKVRLVVENSNQCRDTLDRPIVVYPEVVAAISADPDTGCHPLPVIFANTSTNADYYQWDFADGASSSLMNPFHSFRNFTNTIRTYKTQMIARSKYYCADTITRDILVYPYLKADFAVDRTEGCAPFTIRVTNNSLGGSGIKTYSWNFGDGFTSSSTTSITHIYQNKTNAVALLKLRLVIGNGNGCYDTLIRDIRVYPDIYAGFTRADSVGCHPLTVQYTRPNNLVPVSYTWDFGDGTSSSLSDPQHVFTNNSTRGFDTTYTSRLIVSTSYLCADTSFKQVIVHPNIDASFSVSIGQGCAPLPVSIVNGSYGKYPGISNYDWDFGDGSSTSQASGQYLHSYKNDTSFVKTYNLRLIVRNAAQCRDTLIKPIRVFPQINTSFKLDKFEGCNPLTVQFTNTSNFPVPSTFNWDFGDGTSFTGKETSHVFTNTHSQDTILRVRLISASEYMCADTQDVDVVIYANISAGFTMPKTNACSPFPVSFTNLSRGGIVNYSWDFGDGKTSTLKTPVHTFVNVSLADQERDVKLVVSNTHGCVESFDRKVTIYPEVFASFSPDRIEGCQPFLVNFQNQSNSPVAAYYRWTFGNKGSSGNSDPTFTFTNLGNSDSTHIIRLYAESVHGCFDDTLINVKAFAFIDADFKVANPQICSNYDIHFQNTSGGGINNYFWDFDGDGTTDSNTGLASFDRNYTNMTPNPANHDVRLIVKNLHDCFDTLVRPVTVYPKVTAAFTSDTAGCHPFDVQFTNTSLNGNGLLGTAGDYDWYFGDDGTSGQLNPQKQFVNYTSTDQVKTVRLIAVSPYLCMDSVQRTFYVWHKPKAKFEVDKTIACPPFNIAITNNSVTSNARYSWDFGDGSRDTVFTKNLLNHLYTNTGTDIESHDIKLENITDKGCTDNTSMTVSIYPEVRAAFNYDSSGCSPFISSFANQSRNAVDYNWDFNDNKISILQDPRNRFVNLGPTDQSFQVRLIATSRFDCTDTITHQVTVFGQPFAEFTPTPPYQVYQPQPIVSIENFSNNQSAWSYSWDFGDGTKGTSASAQFTKTYTSWGPNAQGNQFVIVMKATNLLHPTCADTVIRSIKIAPPVPTIEIKNDEPNGCEPFRVKFNVAFAYAYQDSFYWEFDDGTYSRLIEPEHVFIRYGTYNVKLTVTGDGGTNYAYKTIKVHQTPIADFEIAPRTAFLPDEKVKGFNKSQLAESYVWDFGDGYTSTEKDPEHLYTKLGKYPVKLVVYSSKGCVDSLTKPQVVSIEGTGMIEFPNAFTPNMDGPSDGHYAGLTGELINDVFYPKHEGVKEYHLEIYDRWGEKLFETDDIMEGWNGYYKEKLCKQDVYVWKAKGVFWNGLEFLKAGDVTLLQKKD
jgi:PKD repeat protein